MVEVRELGRRETLVAAAHALADQMEAEARQLVLATHWADLHHPDSLTAPVDAVEVRKRRLDGDYGVRPGGEGTPEILASCPAELGLVSQTSAGGAKFLIADALDLRHRLPSLWAEVCEGRVRGWKARKVAQATRHLPLAVMGAVDAGLAGLIPSLAWSRFELVLDATVMRADPVGARHAEAEAASKRFVSLARSDVHGVKTLIARGDTLDILTFLAAVNRIADILGHEGDEDPVEVRRSKAVGILGQPDRALALLTTHQHDQDQPPPARTPRPTWRRPRASAEPADLGPEPEPPEPDLAVAEGTHDDQASWNDAEPDLGGGESDDPDEGGERSLDLTPQPTASGGGGTGGAGGGARVQLYVHLTESAILGTDAGAVCRVEGVGPVTAATVRTWLRRDEITITVRPVVVPGDAIPVDGYEVPQSIREAVGLHNPASGYPWSTGTNRPDLQLDHVQPWRDPADPKTAGPPGQTSPANLAPLRQSEHQRKTSRRWREHALAPGVYLWRSPHGWITLVTNQGTYDLGADTHAHAIWRTATDETGTAPKNEAA